MPQVTRSASLAAMFVKAAEAHAEATGETDFIQGDLEIVLEATISLLQPGKLWQLFVRLDEQDFFDDTPEYAEALTALKRTQE